MQPTEERMRRSNYLILASLGLLLLYGVELPFPQQAASDAKLSGPQTRQTARTAPQQQSWPWPAESDAVTAAGKHHKVLLENDRVRVLDVTVLPGEKEPYHSHCWPSVLYIQQAGDFRDYDSSGEVLFDSTKAPAIQYPLTRWQEPQAPHAIENLSNSVTIHLIRVELKR
jgi:hypothetical protein